MVIKQDKAALRSRCRAYRASVAPSDYRRRSRQICARAGTLAVWDHTDTIHAYWPDLSRREVDIRPLIMYLRALGKQVVLPVVTAHAPVPAMESVAFTSEADLRPNRWGILEPAPREPVDRTSIDAVILPALAADIRGTRLGQGGGYYDRYLAGLNAFLCCPVYDDCARWHLPREPHDIPVHVVVTESRTLHCRRAADLHGGMQV